MRSLVIMVMFLFAVAKLQAQCTVTAFGDTTVCPEATITLGASPGFTSYSWSPATGLSNPNIPSPSFTANSDITYYLTATIGASTGNLITNGDFSLGNTGFTSGHNYTSFYNPGNYYVNNSFFGGVYFFDDHTPTADNMFMSVDGASTGAYLYETNVGAILTGTDYTFSFWTTRCDIGVPYWEIYFTGNVTGTTLVYSASANATPPPTTIVWDQYTTPIWNSGPNTSVTIRVVNTQLDGYGNDFGMDDFYFSTPVCTAVDSVHIDVFDEDVLNLTLPTYICQGDNITLHATGGSSYLWSTGETDSSITVSPPVSTSYTVLASVGFGCFDIDTTTITVQPSPVATITGSDSICMGETLNLEAGGGNFYLWSNGETTSSINISPDSSTSYTVVVTNMFLCSDTTSANIFVSPVPLPPVLLDEDTTVCVSTVLPQLTATGTNLVWYESVDDPTGSSIAPYPYTDAPGTYVYLVSQSNNGCESDKESVTVEVLGLPSFDLPAEASFCEGDSVSIGPSINGLYIWSDSTSTSPRMVNSPGVYILSTWNQCGVYTDSCMVEEKDCNCYFYLPNSFTPTGDGVNDVYQPVYSCAFDKFSLRIFNRWGQVVFESYDPAMFWDGKYKGLWSPQDVYVVLVQYSTQVKGEYRTHELRRHVTLLK